MRKLADRYHLLIVAILFAVYLINGVIYIPRQSVTSDEGDHLNYAIRFVKGHPEKIRPFDDASTMPVSAFNTIPRIAEQILHPGLHKSDWGADDVTKGRYITLLISLFIGLYVYRWAKELFGSLPAVFSLLLFVFCPNLAAHAGLLTTDSYSALFTIAPLYHYWRYTREKSLKQFVLFSLALALAQLCKQSLTFLYPLFFLLWIVQIILEGNKRNVFTRVALVRVFLLIFLQVVVINAGFQFRGTGTSLNNYSFRSDFFNHIQGDFHFMGSVPLPVPAPYLEGLDCTKKIDELGGGHPESSGKIYLLGQLREGHGFWDYYFVVLFFKTPIPLLIAFFAAFILFLRKRAHEFRWTATVLLLPILFFLVYFNFFYSSQVGIRHILMIIPLMQVFAGLFFAELLTRQKGIFVCIVLSVYSVATYYFYFPYLVPYTNEFIVDKKMAYRKIADSNLDYSQGGFILKDYLASGKGQYAPESPRAGEFIISVSDLLGTERENGYGWLRDNFKPSGHLAFTYLIFDISDKDLLDKHLLVK